MLPLPFYSRTQYFGDGLETTITDINVDSAGHMNNGQGKAAFVEQCACPAGYSGLSCEVQPSSLLFVSSLLSTKYIFIASFVRLHLCSGNQNKMF